MDTKIEVRPGRLMNLDIRENPTSDTTIFFIHGLGGRGEQWRDQIAYFQGKYSLIIPDLLGHGKSDKPQRGKNNPYDFMEFCRDLQIIFDQYRSEKNVVIGHSYGGALAVYLTFYNQKFIQKQILIAPARCKPFTNIPALYYLPASFLELIRPYLENSFRGAAFDPSAKSELLKTEAAAVKYNPLYVIKYMLQGRNSIPKLDLSQLHTPTLILTGVSDKIILPEDIKDFYAKLPNHQFVSLEHTGHLVQLEQPEKVNQLIANFLNSV